MSLCAPTLLSSEHKTDHFSCGVTSLDDWLKRRARANLISGASRTYVASENLKVAAYYCLASGALALSDAPGPLKRNMPDPIPMVILGRLAVDQGWQGKGLGVALLKDAVLRTREAAGILGVRGLLAQAISDEAKAFYESYGFQASPTQPMTLLLSLFWA